MGGREGDKDANEKYVLDAIKAYDIAREAGLPVPPTTRYFNDGLPAILMTDLTEGGKYRVWSYNDHPSAAERKTKMAMQLTRDDIIKIKRAAAKTMWKATENDLCLRFHHYHVRQNVANRKIEVVLLDLNEADVLEFLGLLTS